MNFELTAEDVLREMDTEWLKRLRLRQEFLAMQAGIDITPLGAACRDEMRRRAVERERNSE